VRLVEDLERLAEFGAQDGGVSRLAWTGELDAALDWFCSRLEEAGLQTTIDAAGNVIGRWITGEGPAVALGSHLDTVPDGGRYDGALGVLGALAAVELMRARGVRPKRPIWIIAFMDEEGVRFGTSMVGSRAFVGDDPSDSLTRRDHDGISLAEAVQRFGRDPTRMADAAAVEEIGCFLELHIEQGPTLERSGIDLGIVTRIAGIVQARAAFVGEANHAGGTPMHLRRDPMMGLARVALRLREAALSREVATATIGSVALSPGAFNIIPERAAFTVDFRIGSDSDIARVEELVSGVITQVAEQEGLEYEVTFTDVDEPVELDEGLVDILEQAADRERASHTRMASGGGHDAMVLAAHVPAAMLFVPCRDGISHSPKEYVDPEACERGVRVLARALELTTSQEM
jgi:allantoate deiminase